MNHFAFYKSQLDPYLQHVLAENDTLDIVRSRSPILTAAICTVAAFCTDSPGYDASLKCLKDEVARKVFAVKYEFDDVRALCVGALWLRDISSALNGLGMSGTPCTLGVRTD